MKKQTILIIISIIILVILAGALWYFLNQKNNNQNNKNNQTNNQQEISQEQENEGEVIIVDDKDDVSDSGVEKEDNANSWKEFVNVKYKYSFKYPDHIEIWDTRMIQEPEKSERISISDSNIKEYSILEISVVKNTLGMSAVEFAQKSLALAKKDDNYIYYGEKISEFKGENSFEYIAENDFKERGLAIDGNGNAVFDDIAGEGRILYVPFEIIYFDYNGYLWRIMHPKDNRISQEIINSFEFTD